MGDAKTDHDQAILSDYPWNAYKTLPVTMAKTMEKAVLNEVLTRSHSSSQQTAESIKACQDLLDDDINFRKTFLQCWEQGSFDTIRSRGEHCEHISRVH
jgi:exonuclease V gamma subunit